MKFNMNPFEILMTVQIQYEEIMSYDVIWASLYISYEM